MSTSEADITNAAKIVWDYHHMNQSLEKADCIIVLGSSDIRVAAYGAEVFHKGLAPYIVFSGGSGSLTKDHFDRTEAEVFAEMAITKGVPKNKILLEDKSVNTGENIRFSIELLTNQGVANDQIIIITKPYMERRAYPTSKKLFPDKNFIVSSPPISFEDYPTETLDRKLVINIMVGDLQRIIEYPAKGFQIEMGVPEKVKRAYDFLTSVGCDRRLIKK